MRCTDCYVLPIPAGAGVPATTRVNFMGQLARSSLVLRSASQTWPCFAGAPRSSAEIPVQNASPGGGHQQPGPAPAAGATGARPGSAGQQGRPGSQQQPPGARLWGQPLPARPPVVRQPSAALQTGAPVTLASSRPAAAVPLTAAELLAQAQGSTAQPGVHQHSAQPAPTQPGLGQVASADAGGWQGAFVPAVRPSPVQHQPQVAAQAATGVQRMWQARPGAARMPAQTSCHEVQGSHSPCC